VALLSASTYSNLKKPAFFAWGIGLIAGTIISLLPPDDSLQVTFILYDKAQHFIAYAILAHIGCHAGQNWHQRYIICVITLMVSILIEFLQPLTGRSFEIMDIMANFAGILTGLVLMRLFLLLWRTRANP
jgi:VanZ family protein